MVRMVCGETKRVGDSARFIFSEMASTRQRLSIERLDLGQEMGDPLGRSELTEHQHVLARLFRAADKASATAAARSECLAAKASSRVDQTRRPQRR